MSEFNILAWPKFWDPTRSNPVFLQTRAEHRIADIFRSFHGISHKGKQIEHTFVPIFCIICRCKISSRSGCRSVYYQYLDRTYVYMNFVRCTISCRSGSHVSCRTPYIVNISRSLTKGICIVNTILSIL